MPIWVEQNYITTKPLNQNKMDNEAQAFSAGVMFGVLFGIILSVLWYANKTWKDKYKKK